MTNRTFTKRTRLAAPAESVFAWHTRPGALERLLPPWQSARVVRRQGGIADGGRTTVRLRMGPMPITWIAEHRDYVEGERFSDVQVKGPFAHWAHTHRVEPAGEHACDLVDEIEYREPMGALGRALGGGFVHRQLERVFEYRHALMAADLELHQRLGALGATRPLTVAVTGSHGLVARALVPLLTTGGHTVKRIVRRKPMHEMEIGWSPQTGELETQKLEDVDAVVHLAGEPVMGRWNAAKKQRIRDSRVQGTHQIAEALAHLSNPPRVMVSASAVGYYGDRGDELLTEDSAAGRGFLAEVAAQWENATRPARDAGIRVAMMRVGIVLSPAGGALGQMLPLFRLGLGGPLGDGWHWMPWITRNDLAGALYHAICNEQVTGAVNGAAPAPVTNRTFTKVLGRVLHRPTCFRVPRFAARLAFGELADEALFSSARAQPRMLEATGYRFRDPELAPALSAMLGRGVA